MTGEIIILALNQISSSGVSSEESHPLPPSSVTNSYLNCLPVRGIPLTKAELFPPKWVEDFTGSWASNDFPCVFPHDTGLPQGTSVRTLDCAKCSWILYFSNILMISEVYAAKSNPGGAKYRFAFMASFNVVGLHLDFLYRRARRTWSNPVDYGQVTSRVSYKLILWTFQELFLSKKQLNMRQRAS